MAGIEIDGEVDNNDAETAHADINPASASRELLRKSFIVWLSKQLSRK
jgi:hypothetical protein